MTSYFVTGGSGFIGHQVVQKLLASDPEAQVYALVRTGSLQRFSEAMDRVDGNDRVTTVVGELTSDGLGIDAATNTALDAIDHVIHLAALYDVTAIEEAQRAVN
ncbi:MAG: SDR family oxidoreductase, partial [Gordonia sp. (in: high G+C Gram-positive bacteria)]